MRVSVRVTPRASRSEVTSFRHGQLHVRLAAPPVDGAANEELIATIAAALRIRRSAVLIVKGHNSRNKIVDIAADADAVAKLFGPE